MSHATRSRPLTLLIALFVMVATLLGAPPAAMAAQVVDTISVQGTPSSIAVTPDGAKVYVVAQYVNKMFVIDTATGTVTATVDVGAGPDSVAIAPNGSKAYVTNSVAFTVSVIDVATDSVDTTIDVDPLPGAVAVSPDSAKVYITNEPGGGVGQVSVIDATSNTVTDTISIGEGALNMAILPNGDKLYVTHWGTPGYVSVVDTTTKQVSQVTGELPNPDGVAAGLDNSAVYVTDSNNVVKIDAASDEVLTTTPVGTDPEGVAVAPDGVYVANKGSDTVSVVREGVPTQTVAVGTLPTGVAIAPDGTAAYVTNFLGLSVSVLGLAPGFAAAPGSLDFGDVLVGSSSSASTVTVENTGRLNLAVTTVQVTGADADSFTADSDTCAAASVAAGDTCSVDVTFSPVGAGSKSATLEFVDDASGSPHEVTLTGVGAEPTPTPSPTPTPTPTPTPVAPGRPTALKASAKVKKVTARWKADADSYSLQITSRNKRNKRIAVRTSTAETRVSLKLKGSKQFKKKSKAKVCVRAVNAAGTSKATCRRVRVR